MSDLEHLINNAVACANSVKLSADAYVKAMERLREASLKADADLKAKQAAADSAIAGLRSQLQDLTQDRVKAQRELELVRQQIEKERKEIGRERQKLHDQLHAAL
jgi:hypothetical protein